MTAGVRSRLRLRLRRMARPVAPAPSGGARRRSARAALGSGLAAFVLASVGLAAAVETVKPEWRDPEYGHRLRQLRRWKSDAPGRPLVVVFGSSRTQMGIDPAAMGFPDEPGSPVVYNFGYRAGRPFRSWFQLMRLLDAGVKPDFVLLQISAVDLIGGADAELIPPQWGGRLGAGDFRRLAPYAGNPAPLLRPWLAARSAGWSAHRESIVSDLRPDFQPAQRRLDYYWERFDRHGFTPHPAEFVTDRQRKEWYDQTRTLHAKAFAGRSFAPISDRTVRDLVARCRAEGIPAALFWAPESVTYRGWYTPAARAAADAYHRRLVAELGVTVFPAPEHLPDADFLDGFHLLRPGAARYSRWLADTHLKPWLARPGVSR
jgi:hypothetical protein